MSYAQYYLVAFQLMQMQMADSKRKGRAVTQKEEKRRSTQQKLKVIKNANLMLLLPDSLTLCALTVVPQHVVFSVVSCRVLSPLSCFFLLLWALKLLPSSFVVVVLRAAFIFGTKQEMIYAKWPTRN